MGHFWSTANSIVTVSWGFFVIVIAMFPSSKSVDKKDMNYTVVLTCGVWILSMIYFFLYKYKHYHGPKSNLEDSSALESDEAEQVPVAHSTKNSVIEKSPLSA
jgi:hypothetical protein